ncbi:MAG: hypothetical protein IPP71_23660 [Bacteroidetes bacterium]|nr:hypothetical protein [Bacteroidota bacterium]
MKQSIKYALIVLVTGISVTIIADYILQKGFEKSNDDVIGKLNELINDTTHFDVLCFGSSRALAHIDPAIISKETGLTCYNAGLNGGCIVDFNILLKAFLINHPSPAYLIVHVDDFTFETQRISELPRYFPFISNPVIYDNLVKYEKTLFYVKYFRFIRLMYYNDLLKWIGLKAILGIGARNEYKLINGYRVNRSKWTAYYEERRTERTEFVKNLNPIQEFDPEGVKLFMEMIDLCKTNNIKLLFSSSPIFSPGI